MRLPRFHAPTPSSYLTAGLIGLIALLFGTFVLGYAPESAGRLTLAAIITGFFASCMAEEDRLSFFGAFLSIVVMTASVFFIHFVLAAFK